MQFKYQGLTNLLEFGTNIMVFQGIKVSLFYNAAFLCIHESQRQNRIRVNVVLYYLFTLLRGMYENKSTSLFIACCVIEIQWKSTYRRSMFSSIHVLISFGYEHQT